jgi:hypothetical protein
MALFLLAAPISVGLGVLSWFLVERHFLSRSTVLQHTGHVPANEEQSYMDRAEAAATGAAD